VRGGPVCTFVDIDLHAAMCDDLCGGGVMATNLAIDDELILEAQRIGGHRTKKSAVTEALKEYIQRRQQLKVTSLFGKIDYTPDYDYKTRRSRK
jgi:Bacterial antitoxin of type II TA system, VapB